ncbi:MAG: tRNA lysidine(34) synthetase TilS [Deltaproteobacteria bacterium]|nr:tRNA lysidine(34) synthetase TilS [Deltaproteobacteria bacterium]
MGKQEDIINKVRSTIARYGMIARGDRIIVALSGGPDSVCLLDILHRLSDELEICLIAAHYDHGLRGDEDAFETRLSKDITSSMNVPFETEKAPEHLKNSSSLEERAREVRYKFLEDVRVKHKANKIAMGHNLNDQAETVIMRLLRGSGPSGLSGIPPVRDDIIVRPLIEVSRDDITDYLKLRGLPSAVDSSNSSTVHLRNRIRHELMPILFEYQPNLLERLGVLSNIIRDENAFLESLAAEWVEREANKTTQGDISIPVSTIRNIPDPFKYRVIREIFKRVNKDNDYPMEYEHVSSVVRLMDSEKPQCSVDLPNGIMVQRSYQALLFKLKGKDQLQGRKKTPPHPDPLPLGERENIWPSPSSGGWEISSSPSWRKRGVKEYSYSIEGPGRYQLDAVAKGLILEEIEKGKEIFKDGVPSVAYLDTDKLEYPLTARNFTPGDRFVPLGMKGHRKVKDFFIDLKVTSEARASTPILTSGDKIVWVCGYRIDDRFKVTEQTKKVLKIIIKS